MKKIFIALLLIIFNSCINTHADSVSKIPKITDKPVLWVHHSTDWWHWWWSESCTKVSPQPPFGFLSTLTYNFKGQNYNEAMEDIGKVAAQIKVAGFNMIPTLNIHIDRGYEEGKEFQSWFDRNAWVERAKWLEGMVPLANSGKMALDVEPYWVSTKDNRRYPSSEHKEKLAEAIKPFIDVVKKHDIELYVLPGGMVYIWNQIAADMGVKLTMLDEGSYKLPDFYKKDEAMYQKILKTMGEKKKGLTARGIKYLPGFYETALKKPGFLPAIEKLGYDEVWVYIRRDSKVHRYNKFCLPEFYDLEPYN